MPPDPPRRAWFAQLLFHKSICWVSQKSFPAITCKCKILYETLPSNLTPFTNTLASRPSKVQWKWGNNCMDCHSLPPLSERKEGVGGPGSGQSSISLLSGLPVKTECQRSVSGSLPMLPDNSSLLVYHTLCCHWLLNLITGSVQYYCSGTVTDC